MRNRGFGLNLYFNRVKGNLLLIRALYRRWSNWTSDWMLDQGALRPLSCALTALYAII